METVTVTNELPGDVDLSLQTGKVAGLTADLEKKHLAANEKTVVRLRTISDRPGEVDVILSVSPIGSQLRIHLNLN